MTRDAAAFFKDDSLNFMFQLALGSAPYRCAEAGEVLSTASRIKDHDLTSWFEEWSATAERVAAEAEQAEASGHRLSARDGFLRASHYLGTAFFFILATAHADRSLDTWRRHRRLFDRAADLWEPAVERIEVPYEDTRLKGYVWKVDDDGAKRPLVILNNGSDGTVTDMVVMGAMAAVERGFNALTFDGPGQGEALYEQGLPFRHDWERVVTPVVDYVLDRPDVDPDRIVLTGVSQAGYWVPRAVAFEHRIAAAVADPGVMDVRTAWTDHMPKMLMKVYATGDREKFDRDIGYGARFSKEVRFQLRKRSEPYASDSAYDIVKDLEKWNLHEVVGKIECPMLVTDPEDEQFWPGQSRNLYEALECPKALAAFTAAEGGAGHCEPLAPQLRNQRVFDWIEETLG